MVDLAVIELPILSYYATLDGMAQAWQTLPLDTSQYSDNIPNVSEARELWYDAMLQCENGYAHILQYHVNINHESLIV